MHGLAQLFSFLLAAMGLTVLLVWPQGGAGAYVREKILPRILPKTAAAVLDGYVCFGFWAGLAVAVPWWLVFPQPCCWFGCLMVPALFRVVMGKWK